MNMPLRDWSAFFSLFFHIKHLTINPNAKREIFTLTSLKVKGKERGKKHNDNTRLLKKKKSYITNENSGIVKTIAVIYSCDHAEHQRPGCRLNVHLCLFVCSLMEEFSRRRGLLCGAVVLGRWGSVWDSWQCCVWVRSVPQSSGGSCSGWGGCVWASSPPDLTHLVRTGASVGSSCPHWGTESRQLCPWAQYKGGFPLTGVLRWDSLLTDHSSSPELAKTRCWLRTGLDLGSVEGRRYGYFVFYPFLILELAFYYIQITHVGKATFKL